MNHLEASMSESELRKKLISIKDAHKLSFREISEASGLSHAFIFHFSKGSGISYDNALKIKDFLSRYNQPREWKILYQKCDHTHGIFTSHVCKEWYVDGPHTDGKVITVLEVIQRGPLATQALEEAALVNEGDA